MVDITFPLSSSPGATPQEGAGRLINCYAEPLGEGARSKAVWRRSPGMTKFCDTTQTGYRGGLLVQNTIYAAFNGMIATYSQGGIETVIGAFGGTKRCFWAKNNNAIPDIVVVDPDSGAFSVTSSSVTSFADPDLPAVNSVDFQDGYLIFTTGDGHAYSTDINSVTVNALNFGTAESKPDGLLRGIGFAGMFFFFGPQTTEIWADTANPQGFPYSRSLVLGRGLAGRYAVAGQDDGFTKALIWVAEDNTVVQLNGSNVDKISPPDLDRLIGAVTDKDTLEASVYVSGGHSRWVLSSQTWTWEFDLITNKWNERISDGITRWRATQFLNGFNKWICGDTKSGKFLYVDESSYMEDTDPLVWTIESGPVQKFPNRVTVARADFAFSPGTAVVTGTDPIQTDPTVQISWSHDGGDNWGVPLFRKLGKQKRSETRVTVTRAGLSTAFGHRWRLQVSDPVYVGFMGGTQDATLRDH